MIIRLKRRDMDLKKDYSHYTWAGGELLLETGKGLTITFLFSFFFYRSFWALFPLTALCVLYLRKRDKEKREEYRKNLVRQFQECILSAVASLEAGYSAENAFLESIHDMRMLYGENAPICRELEIIRRGLLVNITLEELLQDLGKRGGVPQIKEFAEVFSIAKRNGGSIPEIIRSSAELIRQQTESEEEIRTSVAARKMEQNIMNVMPFLILFYIESGSHGYFDALYHNLFGMTIMTVCMAVYLAAYLMADKILDKICRLA